MDAQTVCKILLVSVADFCCCESCPDKLVNSRELCFAFLPDEMKIYFFIPISFGTNIMRIFDINNKTAKMEIESL